MKTREEIRRAIDVFGLVISRRLETPFGESQLGYCHVLRRALTDVQDSPHDEIKFHRDGHWSGVCDPRRSQLEQNLHRLYHAALCWVLDDPAGGDFVPQLIEDLLSLKAHAVDIATGELVEVL